MGDRFGYDQDAYKKLNSIPVKERIKLLIGEMSLQKLDKVIHETITESTQLVLERMKSILLKKDITKELFTSLITKSRYRIFDLIVKEENEYWRKKLFFLYGCIIELIHSNPSAKWNAVNETVYRLLSYNRNNLTKLFANLLGNFHNIFGDDLNQQLLQYNGFLNIWLDQFPQNHRVAIFALEILEVLGTDNEIKQQNDPFPSLGPKILDLIKNQALTTEGAAQFVRQLSNTTNFCPTLFKNQISETIHVLHAILKITVIEKSVVFLIYEWYSKLIDCCSFDFFRDNNNNHILSETMEELLYMKIKSYPDDQVIWFGDGSDYRSQFLSVADRGFELVAEALLRFPCENVRQTVLAFLRASNDSLLDSADWRCISTGIDLMRFLELRPDFTGPSELSIVIRTITPLFDIGNPKITHSLIKLIEVLCLRSLSPDFDQFRIEALCLITHNVAVLNNLQLKIEVLDIVGNIVFRCPQKNYLLHNAVIIRIFMDLMAITFNSKDNVFIDQMIRSFATNICYIHQLTGLTFIHYVPQMVGEFLRIYRKHYFLFFSSATRNNLLSCLRLLVRCSKFNDRELVVSKIAIFLTCVHESHPMLEYGNYSGIESCFFELIECAAKQKTTCFINLLPRVGPDLLEFLLVIEPIANVCQRSIGDKCFSDLSVFCCKYSRGECINKITSACELISALVENYLDVFSELTLRHLVIMYNILLMSTNEHFRVDILTNVYRIINSYVVSGHAASIKPLWDPHLKESFISILKNCSTMHIFWIIHDFARFNPIANFQGALNSHDTQAVGEIFKHAMVLYMKHMKINYTPEGHDNSEIFNVNKNDEDCSLTEFIIPHEHDKFLGHLKEYIRTFLTHYGATMVDALIPMFKILLKYEPNVPLLEFFRFMFLVINDILECVQVLTIGNSQLLYVVMVFCLESLSKFTMNFHKDIVDIAAPTTFKLKIMFPTIFNLFFEFLDLEAQSMIEMFLSGVNPYESF